MAVASLFVVAVLVLLFAVPVFAQGEGAAARLLLYPDSIELPLGRSRTVEVRLTSDDTPLGEMNVVIDIGDVGVRIEDFFFSATTDIELLELDLSTQRLSLKLVAKQGFIGTSTLGRLLLVAEEDAPIDELVSLAFGPDTSLRATDGDVIEVETRDAEIFIRAADSIDITSKTHPNEAAWYSRRSVNITWELKPETLYSYEISLLPTVVPDKSADDVVGAIEIRELPDGIFTFVLCELVRNTCESTSRRQIMIDGTVPLPFSAEVEKRDSGRVVVFDPVDRLSGVLTTEIAFDAEATVTGDRSAYVVATSPYALERGYGGDLLVRASDRAGNERIVRVSVRKPLNYGLWSGIGLVLIALFLWFLRKVRI